MKTTLLALTAALLLGAAGSEAQDHRPLTERYDLERRAGRFDLPGRLDEVSGLGFTADGRLFAHGDERARLHEIDVEEGTVGKRFSLGDPAVHGDFEGMEIVGERFFLITSSGTLYETREGVEDRSESPYRGVDTGLGNSCEIEGLAYDPAHDELLVACKQSAPRVDAVVVHRLPMAEGQRRPPPISISTDPLQAFGLGRAFHASAIAVDPETGTLVLLAAREELIMEADRSGRVLSAMQLSRGRHPQAEGIAFGPQGVLYIADEAGGRENGRITMYHRRAEAEAGVSF